MLYIVRWPKGWHDRYRVKGIEIDASSPMAAAEIFAGDVTTEYWDCNYNFNEDFGDDLIIYMKRLPEIKWRINVSNLDTKLCLKTLDLED